MKKTFVCIGGFADGWRIETAATIRGDTVVLCQPFEAAPPIEWSLDSEDASRESGPIRDVYTVRRVTWHDTRHGDLDIMFLALGDWTDGQAIAHMVGHYAAASVTLDVLTAIPTPPHPEPVEG